MNTRSFNDIIVNPRTVLDQSKKKNYYKKKPTVLDDMTVAATNWSVQTGTMTRANSTDFIKTDLNCTNALKCDMSTSFCRVQRTISTVFTGTIDLWIYLSADPPVTSSMDIGVSKDAYVTTNITWVHNASLFLHAGWNRLSLNVAEDGTTYQTGGGAPIKTGSTTFADTMNTFRITFSNFHLPSPETGSPISAYIGGIFYGGESQPNIMFNLDDAWSTQWEIFNIFRSRGLTGTISVIPEAINSSGLTMTQLRTMYDWGWDVVNHTTQATAGNLTQFTESEVRSKIGTCRDWLIRNGFTRTANVLVYPENAYNSTVMRIAQSEGVILARGSRNMHIRTHAGLDNSLCLGSSDFGGKTLAQAKKVLDAAELYKSTIIMYGHRLVGTPTSPAAGGAAPANSLDWNQSDYLAFTDDVAARITAGTINNINYSMFLDNCRI